MEPAVNPNVKLVSAIAHAKEYGDREAMIAALLEHPSSSGVERDVVEGTADMLLGD